MSALIGLCLSSDDPQTTKQKGGTLLMQYPQKSEGKELKILIQPETQHRARYLTEGSRGSVKDRAQQGFPTVKVTAQLFYIYVHCISIECHFETAASQRFLRDLFQSTSCSYGNLPI